MKRTYPDHACPSELDVTQGAPNLASVARLGFAMRPDQTVPCSTLYGSPQIGMEIDREFPTSSRRAASAFQDLEFPEREGWGWAQVEDIVVFGNELLWPTINAPQEQARHMLAVRVSHPAASLARKSVGTHDWSNRVEGTTSACGFRKV